MDAEQEGCGQSQAEDQSFTLVLLGRYKMMFRRFSSSLCHPAATLLMLLFLGGPAALTLFTVPPPSPLLMSSSEDNLCLPVSSWESPTSKPRYE